MKRMKTINNNKDMIGAMFLSAGIVMALSQTISIIAIIIDGIITSRVLGIEAYSAVSLLKPLISIILLFSAFLAAGNQVICSKMVGKGKKDDAVAVFTMSLLLGPLFLLFCILTPEMILKVCGVSMEKHPDFYVLMIDYLHGYMPTIPALILIQIIGPIIVMDNNKSLFTVSAVVLCVTDVTGDLLNAFVLNGGVYGMGIATSVSTYIQLALLLTHFKRRESFFHISLRDMTITSIAKIAKDGAPSFVQRLATTLRNLFISRFNLAIALSTAAVAARGVQDDINNILFCIGMGLGRAMLGLTGVNFGAEDAVGMRRLFRSSLKSSVMISLFVGATTFLGAPLIVGIYTTNLETVELSIFAIRCMAIGLLFDTIAVLYQSYLQGIQKHVLLNILIFFERFFLPIIIAYLFGIRYGSKGVLASLAISKIVLVIVIILIVGICIRRIPQSLNDFMFLPEDFGGAKEDNLYAHITTVDEAVEESRRVQEFCREKGEDTLAQHMALALEEMAVNVITHGKEKRNKNFGVDYRLRLEEKNFRLTIRDYCEYFDPTEWYRLNSSDHSDKGLGIRLVIEMAEDVRYFNSFNSNNIIITINHGGKTL